MLSDMQDSREPSRSDLCWRKLLQTTFRILNPQFVWMQNFQLCHWVLFRTFWKTLEKHWRQESAEMFLFLVWDSWVERSVLMLKVHHTSPTWGHGDTNTGEIPHASFQILWYSDKHLAYHKFSQRAPFSLCQVEDICCKLVTAHQVSLSRSVWCKTFPAALEKSVIFNTDLCANVDC